MFIAYVIATAVLGLAVYMFRRTWLANLALLLLSVALCVTALEAYYRFVYARSDGLGMLSRNFAERYYQVDEFGLRASNLPLSPTKPNIVVVGDSHVFGAGLKSPAERFSDLLASHYPGTHVVNLGLSGWDTTHQIEQIEQHLGDTRTELPLVILTYFFNDIESDVTAADRKRLLPNVAPKEPTNVDRLLQRLARHSKLVEMVYYRAMYPRLVRDRLGEILRFYADAEIMNRHMQTLERLRALVQQRYSARLVVVILPFLHNEELLRDDAFYERFRSTLHERGFESLDMQPIFARHRARELQVNRFDPHTNAFANQLIAGAIIQFLNARPDIPVRR